MGTVVIDDFVISYSAGDTKHTETTVRACVQSALSYEKKYDKKVIEFAPDEILNMMTDLHSISIGSLQNRILCLESFCKWYAEQLNVKFDNAYTAITKEMLLGCLDQSKRNLKTIDRDQIVDLENSLYNWTDKAILELLFLGAQGSQGREYCFFDNDNIDSENNMIRFYNGKIISVDKRCIDILQNAIREVRLYPYSGIRTKKVISHGIYKEAANAIHLSNNINDDADADRRYRWFQQRLDIISEYLGVDLVPQNLNDSGLRYYIKQGMLCNDMSFRRYISTSECKTIANRYGIESDLYQQILIDKFESCIND